MPQTSPTPAYRNPALSVEERTADLLSRMTLEEKIGQLMQWEATRDDLSFIPTYQPGSLLHILDAKLVGGDTGTCAKHLRDVRLRDRADRVSGEPGLVHGDAIDQQHAVQYGPLDRRKRGTDDGVLGASHVQHGLEFRCDVASQG